MSADTERRPGRPPVGRPVYVRLGELLDDLDDWADRHLMTRPQAIREAVRRMIVADEADTVLSLVIGNTGPRHVYVGARVIHAATYATLPLVGTVTAVDTDSDAVTVEWPADGIGRTQSHPMHELRGFHR